MSVLISRQLFEAAEPGLQFASKLTPRLSYSVKNDGVPIAGSIPTVYRRLRPLTDLGLATIHRGHFQINRAARQPMHILKKLIPSLVSLKNARRFGRKYHSSDINLVKKLLEKDSFVTLDYKSWELTGYQSPMDLYVYVDDLEKTSELLKTKGFSEGTRGHVVLLQRQPETINNTEQVYFDCIAKGGRSILDAIALELKYADKISTTARFNLDDVLKVQDDLQRLDDEKSG